MMSYNKAMKSTVKMRQLVEELEARYGSLNRSNLMLSAEIRKIVDGIKLELDIFDEDCESELSAKQVSKDDIGKSSAPTNPTNSGKDVTGTQSTQTPKETEEGDSEEKQEEGKTETTEETEKETEGGNNSQSEPEPEPEPNPTTEQGRQFQSRTKSG